MSTPFTHNTEAKEQAFFHQAIDHENDFATRLAATKQLSDIDSLLRLAIKCLSEDDLMVYISQHMATLLLQANLAETSESTIVDYLNYMLQTDLATICIQTNERELALAALTCLHEDAALTQVARNAPSQQIACLAIEKIQTEAALLALADALCDKPDGAQMRTVNKYIQHYKKQQQQTQKQQAELEQLVQKLTAIDAQDTLTEDGYHALLQQLAAYKTYIKSLPSEMHLMHEPLIVRLQTKQNEYQNDSEEKEKTKAIGIDLAQAIVRTRDEYQQQLLSAQSKETLTNATHTARQAHKTYDSAFAEHALASGDPLDKTPLNELHTLCHHAEWLIEHYDTMHQITHDIDKIRVGEQVPLLDTLNSLQRLDNLHQLARSQWPQALTPPPVLAAFYKCIAARGEIDERVANKRSQIHTQITKALDVLEADLEQAGYARLLKRAKKIKQKIYLLPHAEKTPLLARLEKSTNQLERQQELHVAAVEPKLVALCEQAEAQVKNYQENTNTSAHTIQNQLRLWQKEWKDLSQGLLHNAYWTRFQTATEQLHGEYQKRKQQDDTIRTENDQKRTKIIAELHAKCAEWEVAVPNHTTLMQAKNAFHQRWKEARPFSAESKDLDQEFHSGMQPINQWLRQELSSTIAAKQAIIDTVQSLANETISYHDAQNRWRMLFLKWKGIAHAGRDEQALWQKLQAARKALFDTFHAARLDERKQATADVDVAKRLFHTLQSVKADDEQALANCRDAFDKIVWLNQKARHYWQKKFAGVFSQAHKKQQQDSRAKKSQLHTQIGLICDAIGDQVKFMEMLDALPEDYAQPLRAAYGQSTEETLAQQAVALEIALGLETPTEYEAERTAQQMAALKNKFQVGESTSNTSAADTYLALLATYVSAASTNTQQALLERTHTLLHTALPHAL